MSNTDNATFSVSIFYPCYNDWGTIGSMVLLTFHTVEQLGIDYELILVDDGSDSHTQDVLSQISAKFPSVRVVRHEQNRGYGAALRTGFSCATKEWVFYTDGDAQYDVRELGLLLEQAKPDVDIVQGYKIRRYDPLHRIIVGRIYHWIVRLGFGLPLKDVDCDFRLIRRRLFEEVELTRSSGVICAEMMAKFVHGGYHIVEVPVHHFHRAHGKSQFFNFPRVFRVVVNLIGLWIELFILKKAYTKKRSKSS